MDDGRMILPFFSGLTFLIFMIDNGFATHFYIVDNQCPNYLKDFSSAVSSCHKTFCEPYNEEELRRKPSVLYLRVSQIISLLFARWICWTYLYDLSVCKLPIFSKIYRLGLGKRWYLLEMEGSWFSKQKQKSSIDMIFL